jgi:hypothetical protein
MKVLNGLKGSPKCASQVALDLSIIRIICHGRPTMKLAQRYGWLPGARYSNLRDIRGIDRIGLIDIEWEAYSFNRHMAAVKSVQPLITVARDLTSIRDTSRLLYEVERLREYARYVVIVPKTRRFVDVRSHFRHPANILGYSVPTGYGATTVPHVHFDSHPVHLLGGRPMGQFRLAKQLKVISLDCNSITIDAAFGKYFDGQKYVKSPRSSYMRCIAKSLQGVNLLWKQGN